MFVAKSDFNRQPYNLTGLDDVSAGTFDDFVSYNEEKFLRELLGNLFYDALATAFSSLPAVYVSTQAYALDALVVYVNENVADIYKCIQAGTGKTPSSEPAYWQKQPVDRWARLVYGDTYLYYQRVQKWYGMKRLVVPLIYALKTKYDFDNQTSQGVVIPKNENSTTISPAVRIARAMNEYADLCAGDFPDRIDWTFPMWPDLENSLFGYLYLADGTWDDLFVNYPGQSMKAYLAYSFTYPGKTNVFGI